MNVWKGESIARVRFKIFFGPQTYVHIYITPLTLRVRGKYNSYISLAKMVDCLTANKSILYYIMCLSLLCDNTGMSSQNE